MCTTTLSAAQKAFLRSYIPDLDADLIEQARQSRRAGGEALEAGRTRFIAAVGVKDFDGPDYPGHARTARALQSRGLLRNVDQHKAVVVVSRAFAFESRGLCVEFTPNGAAALFDLIERAPSASRNT